MSWFTQPWGLLGLLAVPAVVLLHLFRRRYQEHAVAALFLWEDAQRAESSGRKRQPLRRTPSFWLEVLAALLAGLLLSGFDPLAGGEAKHLVAVLDDSASMTQRSGSSNLFEKTQDKARQLADDLAQRRGGDIFSIARTSSPDTWALAPQRIGSNFGRTAGAALKEMVVSDLPSDLGQAVQAAVERSAAVEDASRTEYYVIGDRRAWDWATDDDKPRGSLAKGLAALNPDRDHVTVLAVGGQHDNLAVVDVKLQDRLAIASVPVTMGIDVKNFGLDPTPATTVAIEVDGQTSVNQDVPQLAPGAWKV